MTDFAFAGSMDRLAASGLSDFGFPTSDFRLSARDSPSSKLPNAIAPRPNPAWPKKVRRVIACAFSKSTSMEFSDLAIRQDSIQIEQDVGDDRPGGLLRWIHPGR